MSHFTMQLRLWTAAVLLFVSAVACDVGWAQQKFKDLVGNVPIQPVARSTTVQVPYLTWGGDVATFLSNGEMKTRAGSTYQKAGLDIQLVAGDDFTGQVKNYMAGKTPFLRGTVHMLGLASEVIGSDPRTKPIVIAQLSWSAGDHIVSREGIKTLNDLKGKKIACQQSGPHVGLLYDSLAAAKLTKQDVEIVWVTDLSGPNGPAEKFRKDPSIGACCVITPDMLGLTGGIDAAGSGAEGTVKGARVVNSTQQMSRSIADVYAVRRDWLDANKPWVEKFVAGYLKGTEELVAMRKEFEETHKLSEKYRQILTLAQKTFGKEVIPTLEIEAHGLLLDCSFVGLPGQISFFKDAGNLSGFKFEAMEAIDLATNWGYADKRSELEAYDFDYKELAKNGGLKYEEPKQSQRMARGEETSNDAFGGNLDSKTIVSYTILFEPNQQEFPAEQYGESFERALKLASTFGNARVLVRGHADPTKTLNDLIKSGIAKGLIQQTGSSPNYRYFHKGKQIDITKTKEIINLIESGAFSGGEPDPTVTMQAALSLSKSRADAVRSALVSYAKRANVNLDVSQITPVGAGVVEPIIPKPRSIEEAKENMRVEFRIIKVDAESINRSDFDF